jgi:hypothetical protein
MYLQKVISKNIFVGALKVTDENSRIRLREIRILGSGTGSVPKYHGGSATLRGRGGQF